MTSELNRRTKSTSAPKPSVRTTDRAGSMDHRRRDTQSSDWRVGSLIAAITDLRNRTSSKRPLIVGISGIDGSGKGFVSAKLADGLRRRSTNIALIAADDWLNLPEVCIDRQDPGEHFYQHAVRLDEMFAHLLLPLGKTGAVDLVAACGGPKATVRSEKHYSFSDIDIVLVEGIFLFKAAYTDRFDFKVWIDCSFETALQRAIERGQEGLPPAETRIAFETIYFPAQRLHLERDRPKEIADLIFLNDR